MSPPCLDPSTAEFIAFEGGQRLAQGALAPVVLQVKAASQARPLARFMVFNAHSSEVLDFDLRGTPEEVLARLAVSHPEALASGAEHSSEDAAATKSGPGRPKLGVVAREVTLLPRHWAWLSSQPGLSLIHI